MKKKTKWIIALMLSSALCMSAGLVGCYSGDGGDDSGSVTPPVVQDELSVLTKEVQITVGEVYTLKTAYSGTQTVSYASSNADVAAVDGNGNVTGKTAGIAFITVSAGEQTEVCKITVSAMEYSVQLGMAETTVVLNSTLDLQAKLLLNGVEYKGEVQWSVDETDETKYTLTANGDKASFVPKQTGDYVITAKSEKAQASCKVKVVSASAVRVDTPTVSIENCDKLTWNAVTGATSYEVMVNYSQWQTVTATEFMISDYVKAELLKDGESIDVFVKANATGNYDFVESSAAKISVKHNYAKNETVEASCTQTGTMVYTCSDCDRTYTDNAYYRPHTYKSGVCEECGAYRTDGIAYVFDDNFIPMPTIEEGKDENSEWRKKYAPYYDLDLLSSETAMNRFLWVQVQANRDDIPEAQRIKCYYAAGVTDPLLTEAYIAGTYNDGKHGELPVKYLKGTFTDNDTIRKVVLAEEIVELRNSVFLWCDSLETVVMPGVQYLTGLEHQEYGANNFNACYNLKELVVPDGFIKEARQFYAQLYIDSTKIGYKCQMELFVLGDGSNPVKVEIQAAEATEEGSIYTENVYYQRKAESAEDIRCETWDLTEDNEVQIRHHLFENKECIYCGAYQDYKVKYAYDSEKDCYYVKDGSKITKANIRILSEYNDGVHGAKPVTYVGTSAFYDNKVLKSVYLPDSVTEIKASAFSLCKNLELVDLGGVTTLGGSTETLGGVNDPQINAFLACNNLSTLVINKNLTVTRQTFVKGSHSDPVGMDIYARYAGGNIQMTENDTLWQAGGERYYFDQDISNCQSWKWNESKTEIYFNESEHALTELGKCSRVGCIGRDESKTASYGYDSEQDCYYVAYNPKLTAATVTVDAVYDDGEHGEKAVTYVSNGAFANNQTLTHVYLPDSVTEIKASAFSLCKNLQFIDLGGVSKLGGKLVSAGDDVNDAQVNAFLACNALRTVVVKGDLTVTRGTFVKGSHNDDYGFDIYSESMNATVNIPSNVNTLWTANSKIYTYDATLSACQSWKWNDDGFNISVNNSQHDIGADGLCSKAGCNGKDERVAANYAYDEENDCYYVTKNPNLTSATVYVADKFNDGIHGEKAVTYIGASAFYDNQTITHVYLPDSVTEIKASAFGLCKNLQFIDLGGVSKLGGKLVSAGDDVNDAQVNAFLACNALRTVVVKGDLKITRQTFVKGSQEGDYGFDIYTEATSATITLYSSDALTASSKIYYYSETAPTTAGNYWHYVNGVVTSWTAQA